MHTVCAAMGLVSLGGGAMMAGQIAARGARHVTTQRIRVDAIGTIRPAALSHDGRLIAFVSGNPESSQGYCCQVYVLDRSTGMITQESLSPDGTPLGGTADLPDSARTDESSRLRPWTRHSVISR